jgi:hypothetical protein
MKKIYWILLIVALMLALPATVFAGGTALERTENAGWTCADIAGAMHCFDPGDGKSKNASSINVKVYDYDGTFLGTEQLWSVDVYAGQPCPQDHLIDLGDHIACHRYSD